MHFLFLDKSALDDWTKVHLWFIAANVGKKSFSEWSILNAYETKKLTCSYKHNSKITTTPLHFSCTCVWHILPFLQKYEEVIVNVNHIQILYFGL